MAEGAGRITDFSKIYRQRAHETQRFGMTPQSMPRLEEVDDMLKHGERVQISLQRMREVVFNHQASMVEPPQDPRYSRINGYEHDVQSNYSDDAKGAGGFAGPDAKKRRGVSLLPILYVDLNSYLTSQRSAPHRREGVTAAIEPKPLNGDADLMEQELCAMRVVCVRCRLDIQHACKLTCYRLRQTDP